MTDKLRIILEKSAFFRYKKQPEMLIFS